METVPVMAKVTVTAMAMAMGATLRPAAWCRAAERVAEGAALCARATGARHTQVRLVSSRGRAAGSSMQAFCLHPTYSRVATKPSQPFRRPTSYSRSPIPGLQLQTMHPPRPPTTFATLTSSQRPGHYNLQLRRR